MVINKIIKDPITTKLILYVAGYSADSENAWERLNLSSNQLVAAVAHFRKYQNIPAVLNNIVEKVEFDFPPIARSFLFGDLFYPNFG